MSAIAGIVSLNSKSLNKATESRLRQMLRAMSISSDDTYQTLCDSAGDIAVGRTVYGADVRHSATLEKELPAVFIAGELHGNQTDFNNDAQCLQDRYIKQGSPDFAKNMYGSFSAIIVEPGFASVTIVTDYCGSCPVYTMTHDGMFYFASEIKALMALEDLPCELNISMALSSLTSGQWMNRQTLFSGVEFLDCATVVQFKDKKRIENKVWSFDINDHPHGRKERDYLQDLDDVLLQAVQRQVVNGNPAILASGGLDSRTILSYVKNPSCLKAVTYTGFDDTDRHMFGDVAIARQIASVLDMEHQVVQYNGSDVLETIRKSVYQSDGAACFLLEDAWDDIRQACGTSFVLMGDQCFSSANAPVRQEHILECLGVRTLFNCISVWRYLNPNKLEEFKRLSQQQAEICVRGLSGRPANNQIDELAHRQKHFNFFNPKRRMIARYGLQVRQPLMDLDVLNLIKEIPYKYRNGRYLIRKLVAKRRPEFSEIPRPRTRELIDYKFFLTNAEKDSNGITSFMFDDNPLMGQFFDKDTLCQLIQTVTSASQVQATPKRRKFILDELMPPQIRQWLAARARRYLGMHAPYLTNPTDQLRRIMMVSQALRHVHKRCQTKPVSLKEG